MRNANTSPLHDGSVHVGPRSSSQEPLLQGDSQVSQPAPLFSIAHTAISTPQYPPQQTSIPSWADEVEQSGTSTTEIVVTNWACSSRVRGARLRSEPLVYPPQFLPTPRPQHPPVSSLRYGPSIPPLRPQKFFPQPPTYDRLTWTDNYPCTHPSPRRRPRATTHEIFPVRSSPKQTSQSPARHQASPSRGPQPSSSRGRGNPIAPTQGIPRRTQGPNFRFHEFTNPLGINTLQGIHVSERINYTSTPPEHTLEPKASFHGQLENEYIQEVTKKKEKRVATRMPPHPSLHGTVLASVQVLLCSCRSPQRLPQHLLHPRHRAV